MSWVTVIWSMAAATCLTMAGVHLVIWLKARNSRASLFFSISAMAVAVVAGFELTLMRSQSTTEFGAVMRWLHVPYWFVTVSLVWFLHYYLGASRAWLAWTVCVARTISLILDFTFSPNLNFREITQLREVPFLGERVSVPVGVPNQWVLVAQLTSLLLLVFIVDAAMAAWRRGNRRRAVVMGGTMAVSVIVAVGQSALVVWGILPMPFFLTLVFLATLLVMGYELSEDLLRAARLSDDLRESEARFFAIANSAPVLIWMSGTDKLCNFFNAGWLEFTGRTLEQELGNGWTEGVHPDDFARCLKIYTESFDARRPFTMEYRLRHRDGSYRWISDIGVPRYESDRNFLGYIGSCVDLTERKRAGERFRIVVEASPNGNVLINDQGLIVLVNAQTEKLFGYTREELIGQAVEILVPERFRGGHPDDRAEFLGKPEARAMGAGRELFARRKDGTEFPVEIGLSPIQTSEGLLVLTVIVDITARKQTEARVLLQRAELTHVARVSTMGALASSLAHELNQPLSAILSNAQAGTRFMAQTPPDLLEIKGALEDIARDAKRAGEVIRQMRGLVKREEPKLAPLDLNRVILDVARLLHSDMLIRKVNITRELDPDLPLTNGDSIQLQQVILNLVLNAFDAMKDTPESRRTVTVRTRQLGASAIQAEITDAGTGIAPERLGTLFEPFRSTKRDGLGVGLSISRSIVEAHNGRIWAQNNPEHGATFSLTLPVHEA